MSMFLRLAVMAAMSGGRLRVGMPMEPKPYTPDLEKTEIRKELKKDRKPSTIKMNRRKRGF